MRNILAILIVLSFSVRTLGAKVIQAVPGKSVGSVEIEQNTAELSKLGFKLDSTRSSMDASTHYFKKGNILARVKNSKVVQLWYDGRHLIDLRVDGKKLPTDGKVESFKKVFGDCEEVSGSGGVLLYCRNRGIEFSFPGAEGPVGFSVIQPSEVANLIAR